MRTLHYKDGRWGTFNGEKLGGTTQKLDLYKRSTAGDSRLCSRGNKTSIRESYFPCHGFSVLGYIIKQYQYSNKKYILWKDGKKYDTELEELFLPGSVFIAIIGIGLAYVHNTRTYSYNEVSLHFL